MEENEKKIAEGEAPKISEADDLLTEAFDKFEAWAAKRLNQGEDPGTIRQKLEQAKQAALARYPIPGSKKYGEYFTQMIGNFLNAAKEYIVFGNQRIYLEELEREIATVAKEMGEKPHVEVGGLPVVTWEEYETVGNVLTRLVSKMNRRFQARMVYLVVGGMILVALFSVLLYQEFKPFFYQGHGVLRVAVDENGGGVFQLAGKDGRLLIDLRPSADQSRGVIAVYGRDGKVIWQTPEPEPAKEPGK